MSPGLHLSHLFLYAYNIVYKLLQLFLSLLFGVQFDFLKSKFAIGQFNSTVAANQ